ncbi:MAG: aldo/keto reductase, partial [Casimicrobiaceae bacterium]
MARITRRQFSALTTSALLTPSVFANTKQESPLTRAIPGTGERLPAVGLGTASVFDSDDEKTRRIAAQVVRTLVDAGGRLIDTASTYGDAEMVLGSVVAGGGLRESVFIATKLEEPDIGELKRSLTRLRTAKLDLLQL